MRQETVERALENERALNALLRRLAGRGDLVPALAECLEILLGVSWLAIEPKGGIFLADADGRNLELVVDRGLEPELRSLCARVPFGRCLCGGVAASRRLLHTRCVDERHENTFPGMRPHGHYILPILSGEAVLGVMVLYLPHGHPREESEVRFLRSVADILSLVIRQIRSQQHLEDACRELEMLANTDVLTGLPNRRFLFDRLAEEAVEADRFARPLSLVLLDIDHFKRINDRFGHPGGDEVLRQVARSLRNGLRRYDVAARFGGEEFALLLPNTGGELAREVAERARRRLADDEVEVAEGETLRVTASFGVAERHPGESVEEVVRRADDALYRAKAEGRDRVVASRAAVA